jgi:hypothetical protein
MAGDEPVRATHAVLHVGFNNANSKPAPSSAARVRHPENLRAFVWAVLKGVPPALDLQFLDLAAV